jgi:hypothetical protein
MAAVILAATALAGETLLVNAGSDRVAIKGYDAVAYFTAGRPVRGSPEYQHAWHDARWLFASAEHRDLFAADPDRYSPQYGGFCAMGMSYGVTVEVDPEAWAIVDGKLYLNYDTATRDELMQDPGTSIAKADTNWAKLQGAAE